MAHADVTRMMNNARIHLPGATDDTIRLELFNVLNDFFQQSNIWQERIDFRVHPDVLDYELAPSDVSTISSLLSIETNSGLPVAGSMMVPGELLLVQSPNEAGVYTAVVSLTVNEPTNKEGYPQIPAWILNKYGVEILDGLLGRMMAQPAKPYSNERMAIYHTRKFKGGIAAAKTNTTHKNVYRGQAWRFPRTIAPHRRR